MGRSFSTLCDNVIYLYPLYYLIMDGRRKMSKNIYYTFTFWAQYIFLKKFYRLLIDLANLGLRGSIMALIGGMIKQLKKLPGLSGVVEAETKQTLKQIEEHVLGHAPDCGKVFLTLPENGLSKSQAVAEIKKARGVQKDFDSGVAPGGIYHHEKEELTELQHEAMAIFSCSNALYPGVFPGIRKFESEIISMVLNMMNGDTSKGHCGCLTSGGTESVLMAVLAHREYFREVYGIVEPEIVATTTSHAALDKACHYFGIKLVHCDPDPITMKSCPKKFKKLITNNTIMLYTNAPSFPHGTIDPIVEIAALAKKYNIGCHVDNCLGAFLLSHMKANGDLKPEENFDMSVDGVTSISVDVHKYGFSSKGCSVVLYANRKLRQGQYTVVTDWPGGLYCTTGAGGSRGGSPIASAWSSLVYNGSKKYRDCAKRIHETFLKLRAGIADVPGVVLVGSPNAAVIAFTSEQFDIYKVADEMKDANGWDVPRMQRPPCCHICVTSKTCDSTDKYLQDLRAAALKCRDTPAQVKDGLAGIYGQAAIVPDRSVVGNILKGYLDVLYTPANNKNKKEE